MTAINCVSKQASSANETISIVSSILNSLNTPVASAVRRALRGDHAMVLSMGCDPSELTTPDRLKRDWLAVNILKKANWLSVGSDTTRRAACLASWYEDESLNYHTNLRLRVPIVSTKVSGASLLFRMRRKIQEVLGDLDLDDVFKHCGFSSGSSTRLTRRKGQAHNKIDGLPHVTPKALPYAIALARSSPSWSFLAVSHHGLNPRDWFQIVPGGRWFTVSKNVKTDRSCEQQPDMNLILQKGVGTWLKSRLKRFGVDLSDQSRNARLALESSLTDLLSTIDLKSASNSVTIELVRQLLTDEWFDLLDALRCEWVNVDGRWHRLSMFSSMGNGFTFELESLIFWAATQAVCEDLPDDCIDTRTSIFGDDIIVPKAAAGYLVELLNYLGFRVNVEKSYFTGPFRESCGTHGYQGVDVTPFYIEDDLSKPEEAIRICNRIREWSAVSDICDPRLSAQYVRLSRDLDEYKGPSSDGDSVLVSPSFSRRGKVRIKRVLRKHNRRDSAQAAGLTACLMLRDNTSLSDPDPIRIFGHRPTHTKPWYELLESRLSIRQMGDSVSYTRKDFCEEASVGDYISKRRNRNWTRDIAVPHWPHELV